MKKFLVRTLLSVSLFSAVNVNASEFLVAVKDAVTEDVKAAASFVESLKLQDSFDFSKVTEFAKRPFIAFVDALMPNGVGASFLSVSTTSQDAATTISSEVTPSFDVLPTAQDTIVTVSQVTKSGFATFSDAVRSGTSQVVATVNAHRLETAAVVAAVVVGCVVYNRCKKNSKKSN